MKKILNLPILILFFGCSTDQTNKNTKTPNAATRFTYPVQPLVINDEAQEGWGADIRLSITEITSEDSVTTYKAMSSYDGRKVGIEFTLPKVKSASVNSPTEILTMKTCGESSDNLLILLSKLYGLQVDTITHFANATKVAFVDLNEFARAKFGKDAMPDTDAKEMKLFFETEDPQDYAELYVNINDKEHWLELTEKDKKYRSQIIKFLTAK